MHAALPWSTTRSIATPTATLPRRRYAYLHLIFSFFPLVWSLPSSFSNFSFLLFLFSSLTIQSGLKRVAKRVQVHGAARGCRTREHRRSQREHPPHSREYRRSSQRDLTQQEERRHRDAEGVEDQCTPADLRPWRDTRALVHHS